MLAFAQGELNKEIAIVQQLNSHCFLTKTTRIFLSQDRTFNKEYYLEVMHRL